MTIPGVDNVYPDTIRDTWAWSVVTPGTRDNRDKHRHQVVTQCYQSSWTQMTGIWGHLVDPESQLLFSRYEDLEAHWTRRAKRAAIKSPILLGLFSRGGSLQQIELHSKCLH